MTEKLPIVDIHPLFNTESTAYAEAANELYTALSEVGFAVIVGHGVPDDTVKAMRGAIKAVFATPRDILAQQTVEKGNYRGFVPLGYFTPNSGKGKADQYEAWKLHTETPLDHPICQESELYGPNRWPSINVEVKIPILTYWDDMTCVTNSALSALCHVLKLDSDYILSCVDNPLTNMTLLNYPPSEGQDAWGIHPHKDFNLLTVLAHDPIGGLEVRNRDGVWLSANCPPDAMVMNVGDMLELWSGGRLLSTPHRVFNSSGLPRQSFPYFSVPRYDVVIEPLLPPLPGYERTPLHVGRSSADIWYSNWPDTHSTEPGQELGDFHN
ncbi:MAG: isopenicillin N synthase family dioxygenase [Ardenticatenaceae bacterium]